MHKHVFLVDQWKLRHCEIVPDYLNFLLFFDLYRNSRNSPCINGQPHSSKPTQNKSIRYIPLIRSDELKIFEIRKLALHSLAITANTWSTTKQILKLLKKNTWKFYVWISSESFLKHCVQFSYIQWTFSFLRHAFTQG